MGGTIYRIHYIWLLLELLNMTRSLTILIWKLAKKMFLSFIAGEKWQSFHVPVAGAENSKGLKPRPWSETARFGSR